MRGLLAAVVAAAWASAAAADDTQYAPYPIGGRAVGLGGAFTAIADDPSAMFYNPAGLVDAGRTSLQVSTNLYGVELAVGDGVLGAVADALVDLDRIFAELQIIPMTAAGVAGFGDVGADGSYTHAYALGAFVPDARSLNVQTSASDDRTQSAYRRNLVDRTFHASAAYAYRVDEVWRVGMAATVAYRTLRDQEETSQRIRLASGQDGFSTAESNIELAVASLLFTWGLKAQLSDETTLGITVTPPSARVWDSAAVRVTRSTSEPNSGSSRFVLTDDSGVRGDTQTGTQVRVGLARTFRDWSVLSFDLAFHAPTRYKLITIEGPSRSLEDDLTLVNEVERLWVANAAVGYETTQGDTTWAFGAYTNLSSAPAVARGRSTVDRLPNVQALGASVTMGLWGEHTATTLGLTGSYGWGRDVLAESDAQRALGAQDFHSVDVRQLRLFFFLSSTFMY